MKNYWLASLFFSAIILCHFTVGFAQNGDSATPSALKKAQQIEAIVQAQDRSATEKLKAFLADEDWYVRGEAGRALGILGEKSAAPFVTPLLQDKHWFVRDGAIEALANMGDGAAVSYLQTLLQTGNAFEKARAAESLARIKANGSIDLLIQGLQDEQAIVRRAVARSLGEMNATKAGSDILKLLKDEDATVRKAAATALGKLRATEAEPLIQELAKEAEPAEWQYAAALYRLGNRSLLDQIAGALQSPYADARSEAFKTLLEFADSRTLPVLLNYLASPKLDARLALEKRLEVVKALDRFTGTEGRDALMKMLDDEAALIRTEAIQGLLRAAKKEPDYVILILPALITRLKKESSNTVIKEITSALAIFDKNRTADLLLASKDEQGKLNDKTKAALTSIGVTITSLTEILKTGQVNDRIQAIDRLSQLGELKASEPLLAALATDPEISVRVKAAEALGRIKERRAVESLLRVATAREREIRLAAITSLGEIRDHQAADALFLSVADPDAEVKRVALDSLAKLGISVERLKEDMANPNWQTKVAALETMGKLGDRKATPVAIAALRDNDFRVRVEAARVLGLLKDTASVEPLLRSLNDSSAEVRMQTASTLGYVSDSRSLPALTGLLTDKDNRVSIAAAEALARMADPRATQVLVKSLTAEDWRTRSRAAQVLSRVAAERGEAEPLILPLTNALRDKDPLVRYYAAEALASIGAKTVPSLIAFIKSERVGERSRASRLLSRIGKPAVVPLISLIEEKSVAPEVKVAATHALGLIGDERAIKPMVALLRDERSQVRGQAAQSLSLVSGAVEQVIEMSNSSLPPTREAAMEALGGIHNPKAVERLLQAITDENAGVRLAVVRALGESASSKAILPLIRLLREEQSTLKGQAAAALAKIGTPAVTELIAIVMARGEAPATRSLAMAALGEIGAKEAVAPLIDCLNTDASGGRGDAIEALGKIGDPRAIEPILLTMKSGTTSIRKKSVAALAKFNDQRAVDALRQALSEPSDEIRQLAVTGLGEIGNKDALVHLERLARSDVNADVRDAAVRAIEQIKLQSRFGNK